MTRKELQCEVERCMWLEMRNANLYNENKEKLARVIPQLAARVINNGKSGLHINLMEDKEPFIASMWYELQQDNTLVCNLLKLHVERV